MSVAVLCANSQPSWSRAKKALSRRRFRSAEKSRYCEERSDEAIHSSFAWRDGLLRGACHRARIRATRWLAMTSKRTFAASPRDAPESLMNLPPKEGVGNAGCPLHPRPRVHLVLVE